MALLFAVAIFGQTLVGMLRPISSWWLDCWSNTSAREYINRIAGFPRSRAFEGYPAPLSGNDSANVHTKKSGFCVRISLRLNPSCRNRRLIFLSSSLNRRKSRPFKAW